MSFFRQARPSKARLQQLAVEHGKSITLVGVWGPSHPLYCGAHFMESARTVLRKSQVLDSIGKMRGRGGSARGKAALDSKQLHLRFSSEQGQATGQLPSSSLEYFWSTADS